MADVFISYKRENKDAVQRLVAGLRGNGLTVWWDQDIAPDAPWEATIERELAAAKVAIVAWSAAAVASENVKAEARRARTAGKLIQVFAEPCEPPLFFGERQGVDLSGWSGDTREGRFQAVLTAARAILEGKRPPEGVGYAPKKRRPWGALTAVAIGLSTALGIVANLGGARDAVCSLASLSAQCERLGLTRAETPSAAVTAAEVEAVAADERARTLDGVVGLWGRQDRNCDVTLTYSVERGDDGKERIVVRGDGYESAGQVTAVDHGTIFTRDTTPSPSGAREQWELHPEGDRLVVHDKDGVATTFVRCAIE